jgi:hypothetical protein
MRRWHIVSLPLSQGSTFSQQGLSVGVKYSLYNHPGLGLGERPQLTKHGITHRRVPTALIGSELFFESHYLLKKIESLGASDKSLEFGSIASLLGANYVRAVAGRRRSDRRPSRSRRICSGASRSCCRPSTCPTSS